MSLKDPEDFNLGEKSEEAKKSDQEFSKLRARETGDMRKVLSMSEGRRVIWKLLSEAGIFRDPFNQNSNLTSYALGQKERGLTLLSMVMEADASAFYQMHRESYSEIKSKEKEKQKEEQN